MDGAGAVALASPEAPPLKDSLLAVIASGTASAEPADLRVLHNLTKLDDKALVDRVPIIHPSTNGFVLQKATLRGVPTVVGPPLPDRPVVIKTLDPAGFARSLSRDERDLLQREVTLQREMRHAHVSCGRANVGGVPPLTWGGGPPSSHPFLPPLFAGR